MHPQSIIHAMVQTVRRRAQAHMGLPGHAGRRSPTRCTTPTASKLPIKPLDLIELGRADDFEALDRRRLPVPAPRACEAARRRRHRAVRPQRRQRGRRPRLPQRAPRRSPASPQVIDGDAGRRCPGPRPCTLRVALRGRLARRASWPPSWSERAPDELASSPSSASPLLIILPRGRATSSRPRPSACAWSASALFFPPLCRPSSAARPSTRIGAVPLGGYVKITGMNPAEDIPPEHAHRAYYRQPVLEADLGHRRRPGW